VEPIHASGPDLLERALDSGAKRLAVISLHAGAGARTVVETVAASALTRGHGVGVTCVPRIGREADEADRFTGITLPEGAIAATAAAVLEAGGPLDPLERIDCGAPPGEMGICRVVRSSEVPLYGPDDTKALDAVLRKLESWSRGIVLVAGAFERHSFAAPDVTQAVVLSVGAGYSGTPERSAAAVRYVVDIFSLERCDFPVDRAFRDATAAHGAVAVDRNGEVLCEVAGRIAPLEALGKDLAAILLPDFLADTLLTTLVRSDVRCTLVVKDPTRVRVSPVYHTAWIKGGGRVAVMEPTRVLAIATNPANPDGPDAEPGSFRQLVAEVVPEIAVHDVRVETPAIEERPRWKFWGS
jgi:hypothetical protein